MLRQVIRICSNPNIDKDKYGDIQSTSHDTGDYFNEGSLQKKATDSTQISNPNKGETTNADNQHKIQSQSWGKKGNKITQDNTGKWESKISTSANTTPGDQKGMSTTETKPRTKTRPYHHMKLKMKTRMEDSKMHIRHIMHKSNRNNMDMNMKEYEYTMKTASRHKPRS